MSSDEAVLERLAKDSTIDYSQWSNTASKLITRIEDIVYNEFPMPRIPLPDPPPSMLDSSPPTLKGTPPDKHSSPLNSSPNNAPSQTPPTRRRTSLPIRESPITTPTLPTDTATRGITPPSKDLPPPLQFLLTSIIDALSSNTSSPPHTAQRLAELILHPTKHYKTLPSFLRALDRVVCVSSPLSAFPLPFLPNSTSTSSEAGPGHLLNGANPNSVDGTEQDVSGATLTPIPWLLRKKAEAEAKAAAAAAARGNGDMEEHSPPDSPSSHALTPISSTHPPNALANEIRAEAAERNGRPNSRSNSIVSGDRQANPQTPTTSSTASASPAITPSSTASGTTTSAGTPLNHSVTQGELLRQEQLSGSVPVPVGQSSSPHISTSDPHVTGATGTQAVMPMTSDSDATSSSSPSPSSAAEARMPGVENDGDGGETGGGGGGGEDTAETVHVRGPAEVGMEDMGPQKTSQEKMDEGGVGKGFDVEAAVGRKGEGEGLEEKQGGGGGWRGEKSEGDGDGDLVIVDADGGMTEE